FIAEGKWSTDGQKFELSVCSPREVKSMPICVWDAVLGKKNKLPKMVRRHRLVRAYYYGPRSMVMWVDLKKGRNTMSLPLQKDGACNFQKTKTIS
ncbi:MAG: hypothetical protein Q7J98_05230, partial [Kiritimatiellia bacterium]|nr:hypothetical protein [Kiritimatiellia bacterium]